MVPDVSEENVGVCPGTAGKGSVTSWMGLVPVTLDFQKLRQRGETLKSRLAFLVKKHLVLSFASCDVWQ